MLDLSVSRQVNLLINLLGIFLVIYFGVDLFYNILGRHLRVEQRVEKTVEPKAVEKKRRKPLTKERYTKIFSRNIFSAKKEVETKPKPVEPVKDVSELEPTTLNLKLLGTVVGEQTVTMAIIVDGAEKIQQLYKEGDSVQGALIKKILRKKVIVSKDGKDEILIVEEKATSKSKSVSSRMKFGAARSVTQSTGSRGPLAPSRRTMSSLLADAKISTYVRNGKPAGFMVSNIANGSLYQVMGLRNGDVVQGVDGKIIRSPDDAVVMYEALQSKPQVGVRVLRKGVRKTLKYNFRK